jgi:predicted amino acid-binding ACT domain protein
VTLIELVGRDRLEMVHHVSSLISANGQVLKDVSYCVWNAFQVVFIYLMFPETSGRTLEELTFCKCANAL